MTTPGRLKLTALNLNSAGRRGVLIPKHAAWVRVSRFVVPRNALAVLLILYCALRMTPGLAAKTEDASEADSLNRRVVDLYQAGKYQEAIPIARQLLEIYEKINGLDHPDTATGLNNLALLYEAMGDYAKAEPLYRRALTINEKALGPDHPDTATSLNNLAELYHAVGDYAEAKPLFRRALAIKEKALGSDHPFTANSLNNLAFLDLDLGETGGALEFAVRAGKAQEWLSKR
jgi:tetratricopeptide (TPR) repeat protein